MRRSVKRRLPSCTRDVPYLFTDVFFKKNPKRCVKILIFDQKGTGSYIDVKS